MRKSCLALLLFGLMLTPLFAGPAEDVRSAIQALKSKTNARGIAGLQGEEPVAGKMVPALYFGSTKMNGNIALVDEAQKEKGGTATIFVKSGDEFVRVTTNIKKDDG